MAEMASPDEVMRILEGSVEGPGGWSLPVPALAEVVAERDRLAAQLAAVRAALLQGGQTTEIQCRAALIAASIAASPSTPEETP